MKDEKIHNGPNDQFSLLYVWQEAGVSEIDIIHWFVFQF